MHAQPPHLRLAQLEGRWHIVATNFAMWTRPGRTSPSLNYTVQEKNGKQGLLDEVKYLKNGKEMTITGWDRPQNSANTRFKWRGKGLLAIASSKWEIVLWDPGGQWMVIRFSKTLFTGAGYDIVSRTADMSAALLEEIEGLIAARGLAVGKGALQRLD